MSMALIAATLQFPMMIIWITCTMGNYIINMTTIGTNALLMVALSTPNTIINMDQIVAMWQSPTVITLTTYTTDTYTLPTVTTGTNTNPVLLVWF